jgi:hypothetical protein
MNMTTTVDIRGLILTGETGALEEKPLEIVHLKSHMDRPEFETGSLQLEAGD